MNGLIKITNEKIQNILHNGICLHIYNGNQLFNTSVMEAKELRIGNYVKVENDHEKVVAINSFKAKCALDDSIGIWQFLADVKPIPLTEQWLLDFGFEVNTPNLRWTHQVMYAEVYKTESGHLTLLQNGSHLTNNPIEYVHQLQNLYFALTGKELTK